MLANNTQNSTDRERKLFYGIAALIIGFCTVGLFREQIYLAALPVLIFGVVATIWDYRFLYYSFWLVLPFSIEFYFGSIGMDLPTEPIMLVLTGIGLVLFLSRIDKISYKPLGHIISVFLLLHLLWILFTALYSQSPVVSAKFFLAKIWYVVPFYFLSFQMIKSVLDIERIVKILAIFLTGAICIVLFRHALDGFTFAGSHHVVRPIFRNHVSYSAIIVTVLPFMWAMYRNSVQPIYRRLMLFVLIVFVLGTYFSYTRAAQLCIFICVGAFYIFKYKMGKIAIISSLMMGVLLIGFMTTKNRYLDFAPDFEKTITHRNFDNLIEATFKMEDISTMERVYRWVAGGHMFVKRPMLGYGPGSFYDHYTKHTVRSFETYVSDNPEKSGMHNYYFMTLVEQGIIGLLLFLGLAFSIILGGERLYHCLQSAEMRRYVMAATLSTVVICALSLMNDLIETDKVGPFFFLNASIIVILSRYKQKE